MIRAALLTVLLRGGAAAIDAPGLLDELDTLKPLTYEGHVEDVAELEESVVKWPRLAEDKLEQIKRRHAWLGNGDSSHPQIQRLFALRDTLTYPTRTEDVAAALKRHLGYFGKHKNHMRDNPTDKSFDRTLDEMRTKEALHVKKGKKGELCGFFGGKFFDDGKKGAEEFPAHRQADVLVQQPQFASQAATH